MLMSAQTPANSPANSPANPPLTDLEDSSAFVARHIGPDDADQARMLGVIAPGQAGFSRRALIDAVLPPSIARAHPMDLPAPLSEAQALAELRGIAAQNQVFKSFIGQGYYGTHTPGVIQRNILENPAW